MGLEQIIGRKPMNGLTNDKIIHQFKYLLKPTLAYYELMSLVVTVTSILTVFSTGLTGLTFVNLLCKLNLVN